MEPIITEEDRVVAIGRLLSLNTETKTKVSEELAIALVDKMIEILNRPVDNVYLSKDGGATYYKPTLNVILQKLNDM